MWFKLAAANFSAKNLGKMADISNSYSINYNISGFAKTTAPTSVEKGKTISEIKLTLQENYEMTGTATLTYGSTSVNATVSGSTYKWTNITPTGSVTITAKAAWVGTGEEPEPETPVNPPSGGGSGDVTLTLADYKSYLGCITGSTNTMQGGGPAGTTDKGNMYVQIPLRDFSNPSSVTVTAGASTKAYFTFFSRKVVSDDNGATPPYASGVTAQTILDAGTSNTATIPSNAAYMYILLTNGTGGSLRPASVTFHNATYVSNSDPASGTPSGGSGGGTTSGGTQTTEKVFDVYWTLGQTISSNGSLGAQSTYAVSDEITVPSGKKLKYTPYSGEQIWMVIGLWNGDTWIERKTFDPATVTSATTIDLGAATKIRIGYGRTSSSNINMDLNTLKKLQLAWV